MSLQEFLKLILRISWYTLVVVRIERKRTYLDSYSIIVDCTTFNIVLHGVIAHQGDILLPLSDIVVRFLLYFLLLRRRRSAAGGIGPIATTYSDLGKTDGLRYEGVVVRILISIR